MFRTSAALIFALASSAGCGTNPAASKVDQGITARLATASPAPDDGLVIDRLTVKVIEVVFDADGPDESISISQEQKVEVDLSDGAFDGLVPIELSPGTYGSPYLGIEVWDETDEPGVVLEGSLDGQAIRFELNSGEVFEAEAEAVTVPPGEVLEVVHTLDPGAWFRGVDGTSLHVGEDGIAVISESSNAERFDLVADALDRTTEGRFPGPSTSDDD